MTNSNSNVFDYLRHPLILLLIGSVITYILIPVFQERKENRDEQRRLAAKLIETDAEINIRLNLLVTTFENYQKDGYFSPGSDHKDDMRKQAYALYRDFDSIAWSSFDSIVGGAYASGLVQKEDYDKLQALNDEYRDILEMRAKALDPVWDHIHSNVTDSSVDVNNTVRGLRKTQDDLSRKGRDVVFQMVRLLR
jgi:hypothetical protein